MKTSERLSLSLRKAPAIVAGVAVALLFSTQMRNDYLAAVIGAIAAILFAGASSTVECAVLGLIAGVIVGPYVGVRMDLGAEISPGWSVAEIALPSLIGGALLTGLLCAGAGFVTGKFIELYREGRASFFCVLILLAGSFAAGCTQVSEVSPIPTPPTETGLPPRGEVNLSETPAPTSIEAEPLATMSPAPTLAGIDAMTKAVFTIVNDEPVGGVYGEPPPDWLAWGAQGFAVAPDGSFWILDAAAAHPPRLLHYDPEGDPLALIDLGNRAGAPIDLEVSGGLVWVLDLARPAHVYAYDEDGNLVNSIEIPETLFYFEGDSIWNWLDSLRTGAEGELLLRRVTGEGMYEVLVASGEVDPNLRTAIEFEDHRYRTQFPGLMIVDDRTIEIAPVTADGSVLGVDLLGVRADGVFYAAVTEEQFQDGGTTSYLRVVHAFSVTGEHLGASLPSESAVWVESNRDLAVGPDGGLYALVSRADHSVDVLRLGFSPEIAALPMPDLTPTVSPVLLIPLLPSWTTPPAGATDLEIARNTLLAFLTYLHDGRYAEAAALFGGRPEDVIVPNPGSAPADSAQFWEEACFLLQCLLVAEIVEEEQVAADAFRFLIEFMRDDGSLFVLGPCCGASEADMPPVWRFPYSVKVIEGRYVVMEPPVYVP